MRFVYFIFILLAKIIEDMGVHTLLIYSLSHVNKIETNVFRKGKGKRMKIINIIIVTIYSASLM